MNTKRFDGILFEKMILSAHASLVECEKELNALNVFPVADGDTGTNMRTTLENGIRCAPSNAALNDYLKALSSGMLLGARGNSGVILSQLFKGIYLELSRNATATAVQLRNAFIRAYKVAYESVIKPVEGTILTVAREGIEQATRQMKRTNDVESLLTAYLSSMEISLEATPSVLPVLAEMGVVDSGAKGYIAIVRGMLKFLNGEEITRTESVGRENEMHAVRQTAALDLSKFNEYSDFIEGYCTEFILQLLKGSGYDQGFSLQNFVSELERFGDSLVVVRDESRIKVHIHTKKPAKVIDYAQKFGEFLTFKLENMQLQHNEYVSEREKTGLPEPKPEKKHKPLSVIAVVNGGGNADIFRDLGCDTVIDGGSTMNASSEEFLNAINGVDADAIAILPNGANMMLAAKQAAELSGRGNIIILPSRTITEGYYALAMDVQDSDDVEMRIKQMNSGIESIATLLIAPAAKDYERNGVKCRENEFVAVLEDEVVCASESPVEAVVNGLLCVEDFDERECCIFLRGKNADQSIESEILRRLSERFPMHEFSFEYGGQEVYDWIIGIM